MIPETEQLASVDYSFSKDILHVRGVVSFHKELIETVEKVGKWTKASLADSSSEYYNDSRNNDLVNVDKATHGTLYKFEYALCQTFNSCAHAYRALNSHMWAKENSGFQVLRYGPGQHFHEHIDSIPGHRQHGLRVLSAITFLNADFEGGELEFPRQKLKLKPAPGDIVLWPSGFTHPHAARDVVSGTKFSCVTWFTT